METLKEFEFAIKRLAPDHSEALKLGAHYLLDKILIKHFSHGNKSKYGWTPLSEEYRKWKQKKFGTLPLLVLTGRLRNSVISGQVRQTLNKIDYIFNLPPYATWVQEKRDFFKLTSAEEEQMQKYIHDQFIKLRRKSAPKATINN